MNRKIKTFSMSMLMTIFLAAGFAQSFDIVISVTILIALTATITDMVKPDRKLKALSAFFSTFLAIYALTTPHFAALEEVYGLALSSEKIMDTDPRSVALLYGIAATVTAIGMAVKFMMIKRTHKKLNTGGL